MEKYLYHMVPKEMKGSFLYPLNEYKYTDPDLYEANIKKYEWREYLLQTKIELFDCLWNDVVFLSPVHPAEISEEQKTAWFPKKRIKKWFKIPVSMLDSDKLGVVYNIRNYTALTDDLLDRIAHLPEKTKAYYKECFAVWKRPLILGNAPHVLYKGSIDTTDVEIIEI